MGSVLILPILDNPLLLCEDHWSQVWPNDSIALGTGSQNNARPYGPRLLIPGDRSSRLGP